MKTFQFAKLILVCLLLVSATAFNPVKSIKGTWRYAGGIYNDKPEGPPNDYSLQRRYGTLTYEAFIIQKGTKTEKYEAGNYSFDNGAYQETQTFSSEPSSLIGKKINYVCSFHGDTLIFKGKLFDGTQVEEYWKKIK